MMSKFKKAAPNILAVSAENTQRAKWLSCSIVRARSDDHNAGCTYKAAMISTAKRELLAALSIAAAIGCRP